MAAVTVDAAHSGARSLAVSGVIRSPGDKSISHRALIFSALAEGRSRVRGILQSEDVQATANALRALGAAVPQLGDDITIDGAGAAAMRSPESTLDCGNSGTTTRLIAGLVAGLEGRNARFDGDASLRRRPMGRIAAPLTQMGARFEFGDSAADASLQRLPMRVHGARLHSIVWQSEHASAQIKGAVLLAALVSGIDAEFHEPALSRDHTERMLMARGVALHTLERSVHLAGAQTLKPLDADVPADPSSAAFFAGLAAIADHGELRLVDVCLNQTRTGAFDVLHRMGASIRFAEQRESGGEPVGTIIAGASALRGTRIAGAEIPRCIDELPLLACVASRGEGETVIADARELRVKESDRIRAVVENLQALGVDAVELEDGMRIVGSRRPLAGTVRTHGDHRLAMAFGVLAALPGNSIRIDDPGCVAVSYPSFWQDLVRATGQGGVAAENASPPRPPRQPEHRVQENRVQERRGSGAAVSPAASAASAASPIVIAIDGPAASGKSSTAQWVAEKLGVRHVDSGAFYRALTYIALQGGGDPQAWNAAAVMANADRVSWRLTNRSVLPLVDGQIVDEALRGSPVTLNVSKVAQMAPARDWVNEQVRAAATATDVVVDGRDIGTVVFPEAALKVFLVADPWERARRRLVQRLGRSPTDLEIADETEELVLRDAKDATQSVPARDAVTIDTTALTQEEQVERIVALARAARERMQR